VAGFEFGAAAVGGGRRRVVYVQREGGAYELREVRTGETNAGRVLILEGLKAGERVVTKGALLVDGEAEQLL
jgi:multidrug efflux pump subunit AcrA (membrane-fusion protein)